MKKFLFLFISTFFAAVPAFAQEEEERPVNEDAFLVQKEIQIWRTDKTYDTQARVYACQAVRLHKNWFLTAAHCVYTACSGSQPCTVQITLAEAELRQTVRIHHSTSSQRVFIYSGFYPGQNRVSSVDVALIRFDPETAEYSYAERGKNGWKSVPQERFSALLKDSPETQAQLSAYGVRLIGAANLGNSRFRAGIVVPKTADGVVSYLQSPSDDIYFVEKLQHFISPGFGVRRGNSGGGVFTPQGDLAGLVSSLMYSKNGSASFYDAEGKAVLTLQNAHDYFMFTGFNGATLNFIRNKVPSLRVIGADMGFVEPVHKNFEEIVKMINGSPVSF